MNDNPESQATLYRQKTGRRQIKRRVWRYQKGYPNKNTTQKKNKKIGNTDPIKTPVVNASPLEGWTVLIRHSSVTHIVR
jgi:hypothetical protein